MASGPETKLVKAIRERLKRLLPDAWICKIAGGPYQMAGIPDLLICYGGRLLALEVKCPQPGESAAHARGRVTEQQAKCLADLHRAGAYADVVISVEEAERAARKAFNLGEGDE
jgi:hypothetical protein